MNRTARAPHQRVRLAAVATMAGATLALAGCAPPAGDSARDLSTVERPAPASDETAEGFDLEKLIEAAQQEEPITIYDQTGKVVQIAEAFSEKYGIEATGVKVESNMLEKVRKEHESGRVIGDVVATQDVPQVYQELVDGTLTSWTPGDMRDDLPDTATYPFLNLFEGHVWAYNSEVYGDTCPVSNIWEVTDEDWKGQVSVSDPERYPMYIVSWNQAARDYSEAYATAYEDYFGEPLELTEPSPVHEWMKRLAENSPIVAKDSEAPAEAAGAPGQENPAISLISGAKFRNNEDKGYSLAPCEGMNPFSGYTMPQSMTYATETQSPNAAKLYIHFASSQEGMDFVIPDGKSSFSPEIAEAAASAADPHGLFALANDNGLQPYNTDYLQDDFTQISILQDYWRSNR